MIAAMTQFFDTAKNLMTAIYRGIGETQYPFIIGLITNWMIAIPLSALFAFYFNFGAVGIRYGFLIGVLMGMLLLAFRLRTKL